MGKLLDTVHSPADIKKLSITQLETLAQEIRERLILTLSKTGGHLGPNLGVVELTLAMHYVFDTPTDKFVFDVSHQAYIHKLLTGRRERFETIRQPGGLNGFMLRTESEHDSYGAGHAGTALSAALGMAVARDLAGGKEHVVALAGDAAFTNGISFEALNNIADQTKRLIVVLNDNEWSIDRNVGAIARYLHKIVTNEHVTHLHDSAARLLERFGGKTAVNVVRRAEEAAKGLLWPSVFFEEFGLTYYGPLDGHDLACSSRHSSSSSSRTSPCCCTRSRRRAADSSRPSTSRRSFTDSGPTIRRRARPSRSGQHTYSEVFADTLVKLANENEKLVAITGAMPNGTRSISSSRIIRRSISTSASPRSMR